MRSYKIGVILSSFIISFFLFKVFAVGENFRADSDGKKLIKKPYVEWVGASSKAPVNVTAFKDDVFYLGSGGIIEVLDSSREAGIARLASIPTSGIIMDLLVRGNFLFASAGCEGVYIFDISDPGSPEGISHIPSYDWSNSIEINKSRLFICDNMGGLNVVNIEDPYCPKRIRRIEFNYQIRDLFIYKKKVYLIGADNNIIILDVNCLDVAKEISNLKVVERISDILVYEDYIYLADRLEGVYILDVSNLSQPKVVFRYTGIRALSILVYKNYLYVGCEDPGVLYVFDVIDVLNPEERLCLEVNDDVDHISIHNGLLCLACDAAGFVAFNMLTLEEVYRFGVMGEVHGVSVYKDYAYLGSEENFYILDVSDPFQLKEITCFNSGCEGKEVFIYKGQVYLSCEEMQGIAILDILNSKRFKIISRFYTGGTTRDIFIHNNYAYLACGQAGLYIFDISDSNQPEEVGHFHYGGEVEGVFVDRDRLYLACGKEGIYLLDISIPDQPKEIINLKVEGEVNAVFIHKDYIHIGVGRNIYVAESLEDISSQGYLKYLLPDLVKDIFVKQREGATYIYVANDDAGLQILRINK